MNSFDGTATKVTNALDKDQTRNIVIIPQNNKVGQHKRGKKFNSQVDYNQGLLSMPLKLHPLAQKTVRLSQAQNDKRQKYGKGKNRANSFDKVQSDDENMVSSKIDSNEEDSLILYESKETGPE